MDDRARAAAVMLIRQLIEERKVRLAPVVVEPNGVFSVETLAAMKVDYETYEFGTASLVQHLQSLR